MLRVSKVITGVISFVSIFGLSSIGMVEAADFPSRPINLFIGSNAGGSTDVLGRMLAKTLEEALGQPVVVQNRTGAGGGVMATQLKGAPPDGYNLGMTISNAYSGNPVISPDSTKYRISDFTHLAAVSKGQCALVTNADKPYKDLKDLVDAAKRGEQPVYAAQSPLTRVIADYIAKVEHVKFKVINVQGGGEIMQAILGGHADFGFSGGPHVDHVKAGKMRVLASAEDARLATSPEVPTIKEFGYKLSSCSFFLVSAPPKLPAAIKSKLSEALKTAINSKEMASLIESLQYPPYYLGPDEVTKVLEKEYAELNEAVARIKE
jgi:tripartite-type tricarboxylate transporter receptor subunit TctC